MKFVTLKTNLTGMIRNEKLEGREYMVVPMIMIVEGVLNGSTGPLYYPAEELSKVPEVWNHKPVVVYHPQFYGNALSACDPTVINNQKIGIIMNTKFDGKRLKAEAWLEADRISVVDNRVADALANNLMMEVSTGLFTENELSPGEFNGVHYDSIARNYRPDHLAILPDQIGACSIADGAGLLRLNTSNRSFLEKALEFLGVRNELSHFEIRDDLRSKIKAKFSSSDDVWVDDVYDDWFVYEKEGRLFKQEYSVDGEEIKISGIPMEVEKRIVYYDLDGKLVSNSREEKEMEKKELVETLVGNKATNWAEEDRNYLMGLEESVLNKMLPVENEEEPVEKQAAPETKETTEVSQSEEKVDASSTESISNMTPEEYLNAAPAGIREVLQESMLSHTQNKSKLIAEITANASNVFKKEDLSNMSMMELRGIAALATNKNESEKSTGQRPNNYFGQGQVFESNDASADEEVLTAPTMNFSGKEM